MIFLILFDVENLGFWFLMIFEVFMCFENVYSFTAERVRRTNSKLNSLIQQLRFKVSCAQAIFIQMSWSKSKNEFIVSKKSAFSEKVYFFHNSKRPFRLNFSSAHTDIERISNYEAIDLTFIIPIHHLIVQRVLIISPWSIVRAAENIFIPSDDFVATITFLNSLLQQIKSWV